MPPAIRGAVRKLGQYAALAFVLAWAPPSFADRADGPAAMDTPELIGLGAAMALPADLLVTTQHEGSHALAATIFGAHVTSVRPYPIEVEGHVRFGQTTWTGTLTPGQHIAVMLAPKMTDLVGLTTYGVLEMTDSVPHNQLAQLAVLTVASAMWVDFTEDIGTTWDQSDLGVVYSTLGAKSDGARLPYRMLQGGIAALAVLPLVHGYVRLFGHGRRHAKETLGASIEPFADVLTDCLDGARGQVFGVRGVF